MIQKKYAMVRVSAKTLERLKAEISRLIAAHEQNRNIGLQVASETINPAAMGISLDALINQMLDARESHRERSKRSRSRKPSDR